MSEVLKPKPTLLVKLGSITIHIEEMFDENFKNIDFDRPAIESALNDPEVKQWLGAMDAMALLPKKRKSRA